MVLGLFLIFTHLITGGFSLFMKSRTAGYLGAGEGDYLLYIYWLWKSYTAEMAQKYLSGGFSLSALLSFLKAFFKFPINEDVGSFTPFLIFLPLEKVAPFPLFYNLYLYFTMVLNGFCFYLLANYVLKNRYIATGTGMIFAASPFLLRQLMDNRIEQLNVFFMPLFILYFLKTLYDHDESIIKSSLLCGLFLALISLFYWYYGIFMVLFALLWLIYYVITNIRDFSLLKRAAYLMIGAAIFSIIVVPFAFPYIDIMLTGSKIPGIPDEKVFPELTNLRDSVHITTVYRSYFPEALLRSKVEYSVPFFVTFLFLISLFFIRKIPLIWYISAIFFYSLSWGPYLKLDTQLVNPPVRLHLYTLLYQYFPFFRRFQWPDRFMLPAFLCMVILAGFAMKHISEKFEKKFGFLDKALPALTLLLSFIFIGVVGYYPIVTSPVHSPSIYKEAYNEGAKVLDLPLTGENLDKDDVRSGYLYDRFNLDFIKFHHMFHVKSYKGLKQLGAGSLPLMKYDNSFMKYLIDLSLNNGNENVEIKEKDYREIRDMGYKYVVLHGGLYFTKYNPYGEKIDFETAAQELEKLCGPPIKEDYEIRVPYKLGPGHIGEYKEKFKVYIYKLPKTQQTL